jgi:uncharacterized protein (DUF302 family)
MRQEVNGMEKVMRSLFIVVFILCSGVYALADQSKPQMFLQSESPKSLSETIKVFREEVAAGGWSILNVTNMAGVLSERGYTVSPVLIFDVCSGKYSANILAKDENRFVTPLMPCRIGIYQTSQGKVVIARLNAKSMAPMFSPELAETMIRSGDEIEVIIGKTISRLKTGKK